jgi:hypothetical protein
VAAPPHDASVDEALGKGLPTRPLAGMERGNVAALPTPNAGRTTP